jgi:hypothetical protein
MDERQRQDDLKTPCHRQGNLVRPVRRDDLHPHRQSV